jgi:hypothetical protein
MPHNHLIAYVNAWTVQAVLASQRLTRLYRVLADERQAALAIQAGAPAMERMERLGLQAKAPSMEEAFQSDPPNETQAEQAAWAALIEAHTGLAAFYALCETSDAKPAPGLRGSRTATHGALRKALRGIRTAFPEAMAEAAAKHAKKQAIATCVTAFMTSVEANDCADSAQLRLNLEACVLEALEAAFAPEGKPRQPTEP